MRIISRLFLLVSLAVSTLILFADRQGEATAQLGYGCYTFATTLDACLTGCTEIEVQQFSNGEGATRLESIWLECDAGVCANYMTRAVPNPACCDRDDDGYRGTRPGCGTGSDCNDDNPSVRPGVNENCSDGIDNNCNGQTDCNDSSCLEACCDVDGDGYWSTSCYGDDCNDGDPNSNPGAYEGGVYVPGGELDCSLCQDGVDNNCDGLIDFQDPNCFFTCGTSPIVIDTSGDGFDLTSASAGVLFDMRATGQHLRVAWIQGDDAWLALDRNGNGAIDDGKELFGNFTPQPPSQAPNGFIALAEYDKPGSGGNGDGRINRHDTIFNSLRLWKDTNRNGISEYSELYALPRLGVGMIDLDYKESRRRDEHGNWFRYRAKVRDTGGGHVGRWAWDVFLVTQ